MAIRPIFIPNTHAEPKAQEKAIEFTWFAGFSTSQKQKSIAELHKEAKAFGVNNALEISSKSKDELGVQLSAFNLTMRTRKSDKQLTVETAFQGSKVFKNGGPFTDLYGMDSLSAKREPRLRESGPLIAFEFFGKHFPLEPKTFFYDWLYINALIQNDSLATEVLDFDGFTDIEFNPKKSINCQAHALALYVSLEKTGRLEQALSSSESFLTVLSHHYQR